MQITQADCIRTGRLELRSYESGDAKRIVELLTNPEVSKTFMVPGFQSEQQALDLAHKLIAFSKTEDTAHSEFIKERRRPDGRRGEQNAAKEALCKQELLPAQTVTIRGKGTFFREIRGVFPEQDCGKSCGKCG